MRQLLNTLFVTSEDIYLSLDGENVVANRGGETVARYPLHTLQSIVTFSYAGASPALMGKCAQREIGLAFCSQRGKFLARVSGQMQGNVLLRRMQYRVADDPSQSCRIARNMIFGKVYELWNFSGLNGQRAMLTAAMIALAVTGIYIFYFIITYRIACDHVICYGNEKEGQVIKEESRRF